MSAWLKKHPLSRRVLVKVDAVVAPEEVRGQHFHQARAKLYLAVPAPLLPWCA